MEEGFLGQAIVLFHKSALFIVTLVDMAAQRTVQTADHLVFLELQVIMRHCKKIYWTCLVTLVYHRLRVVQKFMHVSSFFLFFIGFFLSSFFSIWFFYSSSKLMCLTCSCVFWVRSVDSGCNCISLCNPWPWKWWYTTVYWISENSVLCFTPHTYLICRCFWVTRPWYWWGSARRFPKDRGAKLLPNVIRSAMQSSKCKT